MTNPNTRAMQGDEKARAQYEATLSTGWLPLVPASVHPSIIQRWHVEHIVAPGPSSKRYGSTWDQLIWTPAWIAALFALHDAMDLFTNAWTTIGENKLKVVLLKERYDETLNDKLEQLSLLVERQLQLPSEYGASHKALKAAIEVTRRAINESTAH